MSLREIERLAGGRLMVGFRGSGPEEPGFCEDIDACREAGVGGVILFDVDVPAMRAAIKAGVPAADARARATRNIRSRAQLRELVGLLREILGAELLIAIDQEGGAVARLGPGRGFAPAPSAAEFARMTPVEQAAAAAELVRPLAAAGICVNFAPCVDLALAKEGGIARAGRAFGADPEQVIACGQRVLEAHAAAGVTACLKHFPGHGSAAADSHEALPDITQAHREAELAPYRALRAPMVMTGHLLHRRLDPQLPASLSPAVTTTLLRGDIGFEGVIVTDSLDMRAIRDRWSAPEAALLALRAGADLALDAHNLTSARACEAVAMRDAIARAARDGDLDADGLRASADKIKSLIHSRKA